MKKLLLVLALFSAPAYAKSDLQKYHEMYDQFRAEQDALEAKRQIEVQARMREAERIGEEREARVMKSVEEYLKVSDEYSKFLAKCKTCVGRYYRPSLNLGPMIRIPKDNSYVPICAYGSC